MSPHKFRLVVTGSKGLVGSHVVEYANAQGTDVLGVDVVGRGEWFDYRVADLTDAGQAYDVLYGADAVVHMAAINAQRVAPASKTFMTNVSSTFNVLQACAQLGVRRVVTASSIQVHHSCTPRTPIRYQYLPFDEDHPVDPQDEYTLSKASGETVADTFARHYGLTIVSMRFAGVKEIDQIWHLEPGQEPEVTTCLYSYVGTHDAARACYLAATVDLPPNSHTPLLIAARDTYVDMPSLDFARRYYPEAEIRPGLEGFNSFVNCARAEQVLGFVPEYSCRL